MSDIKKAVKKSIAKYSYKQNARIKVQQAILQGKLVRPHICCMCHIENKKIQGHHKDYSKPLEVKWLCITCHSSIHHDV